MTSYKFIPLLILTFAACTTQNDKSKTETQQINTDSLDKVKNSQTSILNSDTLTVDKKAAVFYSPATVQIAKRKKEIGEENFYVGADDYLNYLHTS